MTRSIASASFRLEVALEVLPLELGLSLVALEVLLPWPSLMVSIRPWFLCKSSLIY